MDESPGGASSAPEVSAESPAGSADGAPASPLPSQEPKPSVRQLFDRVVLGRGRQTDAAPASEQTVEDGDGEPKEPDKKPDAAPAKRELTDEEFNRAVQAETDRREAKRIAAQKADEVKRLRDQDPEAYVEQEKEAERQMQELVASVGNTATIFDEALLNPVILALPEKERAAIIGEGITGLDGRASAVTKALDVLKRSEYERGKADGAKDAEQKLRKNPAVLKQVLVGEREDTDEPDIVSAGGAPAPKVDGNTFLRSLRGSSRGRAA